MRVIPVDSYYSVKGYDSLEAAIEGAYSHPEQAQARDDTERLAGSRVVDAYWTDSDCVIRFTNELLLHIRAEVDSVVWETVDRPPELDHIAIERVGAPPIVGRWRSDIGDRILDRSALAAKRRGREFKMLFVNEVGLYVYCRGVLIWMFQSVRRTDLDQPMLWVTEAD
jgi:hypothetical protein